MQIPESIRTRITKLLALAQDSRGNEHEVAMASAKVQALLAEYNLEMSQVVGNDDSDPDAERDQANDAVETFGDWQTALLSQIAENNFCLRVSGTKWDGANRTFNLIGRRVNIATTVSMYGYLTATIERLCPFADRRTRAHRSWKEGCADRLRERLYEQRRTSERESKARASANAERGDGSSLVLSDVYSSEDDLNRDMYRGVPAGTTARERAANEARWAEERVARASAPAPEPIHETDAQRRKRVEREAAENKRFWERHQRAKAKRESKRDRDAYAMGANAGSQISLASQIGETATPRIR